ncbi:MAG: phenylalanine--tRNA ligase subunit beta, partial [Candidatus Aenigmatarchaeota archaeon]
MAVVEFMKKDLERIVGRRLTDKEYRDVIPMIGAPLERIDKDRVEYEVFPDRPDMLSIEGFGRALRSFLGVEKGLRRYSVKEGEIKVRVEKSVKVVRPYISCAVLRNVRINEDVLRSLMQVQEKLHETFGRKRKKIAIGIHDLDKVEP